MKKSLASITTFFAALLFAFLVKSAPAQTYTDLFNFNGANGAAPTYPNILTQGRDGNLYSTTLLGGDGGSGGVVFKVSLSGEQTVLFNFGFESGNGYQPWSGLTLGLDGNFYGTTTEGGSGCTGGCGTIFKITPRGNLTTLYSFTGGADGYYPIAPPIQAADHNFYGTAAPANAYKITPDGVFTTLPTIPGYPTAPLLQASNGHIYGTTYRGGRFDAGTLFKLYPGGATTLYSFEQDQEVFLPIGGLIEGNDGSLYGTAGGGAYREGAVFKLTPTVGMTVLHNFGDPDDPNDGEYPTAGLVLATDGNFYGVTCCGGNVGQGYGVLYEVSSSGVYSVLYNFDYTNGGEGFSSLMQDTDGKLYGLTQTGGLFQDGALFSYDLGLQPFIRLESTSGRVGQTTGILGQGFTTSSSVSFNGTVGTLQVLSPTYVIATVPVGATSGYVTITTASGTLTSNVPFNVIP